MLGASWLVDRNGGMIEIAVLVIRLFIGPCLTVHGLGKLGVVGPGNMKGFVEWLGSLGFPLPHVQARVAMLTELIGGLLITIGLLTRPTAAICILTLLVAAFWGHKGGGYLVTNNPPGNEYPVNLAAILAALILLGPGAYSLDACWFAGS